MDAIWIKYPIERKGSTTQTASFWCIVVTALCLLIAFYAVQEQTVSEQSSFDTGSCTANNVDTRIASFSITNFNAASQFTALNCNDTIDAVVTNADLASYRYLVVGNWDSNNALTARTNLFLEFTYQIFGGATVSYRPAIEAETDRAYTFADDDFVAKCETFIAKAPDQYGPTCGRTAGTTCIDRCSMEYSKNVSVSDLLPWDVFNVTTLDYNITKKDMDLMMDEIRFEWINNKFFICTSAATASTFTCEKTLRRSGLDVFIVSITLLGSLVGILFAVFSGLFGPDPVSDEKNKAAKTPGAGAQARELQDLKPETVETKVAAAAAETKDGKSGEDAVNKDRGGSTWL